MPAKKPRKSMLYTRTGDDGTTALFGGRRVRKDAPRVEAYGAVDELNSAIGVAVSVMRRRRLIAALQEVQNELFNIGSELASAGARRAEVAALFKDAKKKVASLEKLTDEYDARLPALRTFILPGGSRAGAQLHLCRTVCRRAERAVVTLGRKEKVRPEIGAYLNRLSDLLFALARYENRAAKKPETPWRKG